MKKLIYMITAAALFFAVSAPAFADPFVGPRVELSAGYTNAGPAVTTSNFDYGVSLGYDVKIGSSNLTVGPEIGIDNFADRRNVNAGARVGIEVSNRALIYGDAGWANVRTASFKNIDGLRLGGGLQVQVAGPVYAGAGYRYTDLGSNKEHQGTIDIGYRF
jgi:opacity protein-like surface antigen